MSNISSESSSMRTLTATWRPAGMVGGFWPDSSVLMPSDSGAPNLCPAEDVGSCSTIVFLAPSAGLEGEHSTREACEGALRSVIKSESVNTT